MVLPFILQSVWYQVDVVIVCVCLLSDSSMMMHLSVCSCARILSSTNLFCGQLLCMDHKHGASQAASQICVVLGARSTHHWLAHRCGLVQNSDLVRLSLFIWCGQHHRRFFDQFNRQVAILYALGVHASMCDVLFFLHCVPSCIVAWMICYVFGQVCWYRCFMADRCHLSLHVLYFMDMFSYFAQARLLSRSVSLRCCSRCSSLMRWHDRALDCCQR